jgi:hypothetical protein
MFYLVTTKSISRSTCVTGFFLPTLLANITEEFFARSGPLGHLQVVGGKGQ